MDTEKHLNLIDIEDDLKEKPDIIIEEHDVVFNEDLQDDINDDYKFIRQKNINSLCVAEGVLNHAIEDMKINPGPRSVEAISSLIQTINKTGDRIIELHQKMEKMKPKTPEIVKTKEGKKTVTTSINDILDTYNANKEK